MGSDPLTKFLSSSALKKLSSRSEILGQDGSFFTDDVFLLIFSNDSGVGLLACVAVFRLLYAL